MEKNLGNYLDDLFTLELWYLLGFKDPTHIKCASTKKLRKIFIKYSSYHQDGELYMTSEDFVGKFLGYTGSLVNHEFVKLLAGIADTNKDGLISFSEFQAFERLLCAPDALYKTTFQLFDIGAKGAVSYDDFVMVIEKIDLYKNISINRLFVEEYFGKDKSRKIPYAEFSQFIHDFHTEQAIEAFKRRDPTGSGFITSNDFEEIMVHVKKHLLTKAVRDNLAAVTAEEVSFPYFMAFNSLLNNIELLKRIYLNATNGQRTQPIAKGDLLYSAQAISQITPLEIDILFQLIARIYQRRKIVYKDLSDLSPNHLFNHKNLPLIEIKDVNLKEGRSAVVQILETGYRFTLGSLAGAIGASLVYPIDLVKTRMQNQRKRGQTTKFVYTNSWDCFKKVIRYEGPRGLYRGLVPQLCGVAPEKAIKLTVNDFARDHFTDEQGNIPRWAEVVAGGCAGGSQVVFTNPLEIVKIRLQVAGESGHKIRALTVVKELGVSGLYKGSKACFLRDIPFSAIYFPLYAYTKTKLANEDGYNNPGTLLLAGTIAGIPAASLVTPADVIKTRLQVVPQPGQTTYTGIMDAIRKIAQQEGLGAFWKGTAARVCRSSPQFGFTLASYELLQRLFYIDFGGSRPTGSDIKKVSSIYENNPNRHPDHIGGYSVAIPMLNGIETKFGLNLPKFAPSVNPILLAAELPPVIDKL